MVSSKFVGNVQKNGLGQDEAILFVVRLQKQIKGLGVSSSHEDHPSLTAIMHIVEVTLNCAISSGVVIPTCQPGLLFKLFHCALISIQVHRIESRSDVSVISSGLPLCQSLASIDEIAVKRSPRCI